MDSQSTFFVQPHMEGHSSAEELTKFSNDSGVLENMAKIHNNMFNPYDESTVTLATETEKTLNAGSKTVVVEPLGLPSPAAQPSLPAEGGLEGWMTVAGAWMILFSTMGYTYSFGVYQDFYTRVFLANMSSSSIAWMGSLQLCLAFAGGLISGKLFDAGYVRPLMLCGSFLFSVSLFMLSLTHSHKYYQIFLAQGVGMGLGGGLLFTPCSTLIGVRFRRRRSFALGIAMTGISCGAVALPILLNNLIPRIGFASAVRVTGYVVVGCLVVGNLIIRPLQLPKRANAQSVNIAGFFTDVPYMACTIGSMIASLGAYFPVFFIQLYAIEVANVKLSLAFYSLAILNGSGILGRIIGNYLADIYGVWNIFVPMTLSTGGLIFAILGVKNAATLVVISILYGISSSAWLSLALATLASLSPTPQEAGMRVGVSLAFISIGLLGSAPAQGALLGSDFQWIRPVAFSGAAVFASSIFFVIARYLVAKRKGTWRV